MLNKLKRPQTIIGIGEVIAGLSYFLAELFSGGFGMNWPLSAWQWASVFGIVTGASMIVWGFLKSEPNTTTTTSLEDVKTDLVTLSMCERESATKKAEKPCSKELAMQIHDDFTSIFGMNTVSTIVAILQEIVRKDSIDPLITFFKKFGDILDSNEYGLKKELENNDLYKLSRTDLAQKRVKLKMGRKRKIIIQDNINRVRSLSYGLSSSILLRSVLSSVPETKEINISVIRVTLEGIETAVEQTLNAMLNDIENEWKISKETREGLEATMLVLSVFEGVQGNE